MERDDAVDQQPVDDEDSCEGDEDGREQRGRRRHVDGRDQDAREHRAEREDACVVGDPDGRPVLEDLDDRRRGEGDDHRRLPAEEDDGRGCEDEAERDAARVHAVDLDGEPLRQHRDDEQRDDAGDVARRSGIGGEVGDGYQDCGETRYPHGSDDGPETGREDPAQIHAGSTSRSEWG